MAPNIRAAHYEPETPIERIHGISMLLPIESRNGFVFLIAHTINRNADIEMLYQILSEQLHRLATAFGKDANPQHRFEQFLGSLNETLAQHVREGTWNLQIDRFNAVLGIAVEEQMYLSGTGELTALFLHKQPSHRYQLLNISRSIQTEQTLPTWEKAFAVVLDGDLHEGDVFCLSNKELQREISSDELNGLLTTLPPSGSIEKIRQYFSMKEQVLIIVLKVAEKMTQMKEGYAKPLSDLSIHNMTNNEAETSSLLEDRKPKIGRMIVWLFEKLLERKMASRLLSDLKKTQPSWKTYLQLLQKLVRSASKITKRAMEKITRILSHLGKKETRSGFLKNVSRGSRDISTSISNVRRNVLHLPRSTRYLVAATVAAIILLTFSVSFLSKSKAEEEALKQYTDKLSTIEDTMQRAAGAVIYKDENQARSLYVNATALIDSLPKDTEQQQAEVASLKQEIEIAMNELRRIVTIPNPALLGDLALVNDGVFAHALTKIDSQLYVFGSDGRVYALNKTQKVFKASGAARTTTSPILAASSDNNQTYALSADGVIQLDTQTQEQKSLELSDATGSVDLMAYANRLYVLQPKGLGEGQIYRYARAGGEFGSATKWIEAKTTELDNAVSFVIDGSVFVLKKDGTILKYVNGSEVGWNTGLVDPPITTASDIWTDPDSLFIYVLEPATKRLIVFKKETGEFVLQYRSDTFQELTDFVVDEKDYTIYLLTGSKLYSIAASHLK